jgi:hypothetical protein
MIFPAPHPRETIASYGYRIARLSGLASLPELTHLFDLELRALLMGDRHSIERLARYTGCDPQALVHGALDARNPRRLQLGGGSQQQGAVRTGSLSVLPGLHRRAGQQATCGRPASGGRIG